MEISRPDAIISDLDGTLVTEDQRVGARDLAAIRRMKELGIPVLPGTGRPPIRVRRLMEELELELALCSNGGCCYDFARGEIIFSRYMETDLARRLIDWMEEHGQLYILHTPTLIYRCPKAEYIPRYDTRGTGDEGRHFLTPEMRLEDLQILKILAVECREQEVLTQLQAAFSEQEITACSSETGLVDCNPSGVTKGIGLRRLAKLKGWRMENLLVLGDNFNDRTMLEAAGKTAVPASGVAEIRALADFVTSPCGEDPLAAALDHFYPGLLEGI